jgi:hypothetical protein
LEAVRSLREMQAGGEQRVRSYYADPEAYERTLPEGVSAMFGIVLTWDTLIILSLLGDDELAARVDEYRRSPSGDDPEEKRLWRNRLEQLRPLVKERLRRDGGF